jgi:hypothetical protein
MAWIGFAVTFVSITLDKLTRNDAVPWLLALAVTLLVFGIVSRRTGPWWSLPLQTTAMLLLRRA